MATQTDPVRYGFPRTTASGISKRLKCYAHQSPSNLVRVGVIGYGYWGPNVVRNLQSLENCQLVTICDKNSDSLRRASRVYPDVELTTDFSELLTAPQIDAIAVVTPVWTHFELAKAALQHGVKVVWDLAPHDLSIMDYVIRAKPEAVVATGGRHLNGLADVAFITVYFPRDVIAHINVNWLSPVKVRKTLIGGEKKMLVWNDLEADEKIKVYDKGVQMTNGRGVYDLMVRYRSVDVCVPKIEQTEALKVELEYFIDCILNDRTPLNDGAAGLRVVKILEMADLSLHGRGRVDHP